MYFQSQLAWQSGLGGCKLKLALQKRKSTIDFTVDTSESKVIYRVQRVLKGHRKEENDSHESAISGSCFGIFGIFVISLLSVSPRGSDESSNLVNVDCGFSSDGLAQTSYHLALFLYSVNLLIFTE